MRPRVVPEVPAGRGGEGRLLGVVLGRGVEDRWGAGLQVFGEPDVAPPHQPARGPVPAQMLPSSVLAPGPPGSTPPDPRVTQLAHREDAPVGARSVGSSVASWCADLWPLLGLQLGNPDCT